MSDSNNRLFETDRQQFEANRRNLVVQLCDRHAGEWVAISLDGDTMAAHAISMDKLFANLQRKGICPSTVVMERLPAVGEDTWI